MYTTNEHTDASYPRTNHNVISVLFALCDSQTFNMKIPMRFRDYLIAFISVLLIRPSGAAGKTDDDFTTPAPAPTTGHYVAIGNTEQSGKIEDDVDYYCQPDDSNQAVYQSSKHGYDIAVSCCTDGEQIVPDGHPGADQINFQRDGWRYKPSGSNSKCNPGGYVLQYRL